MAQHAPVLKAEDGTCATGYRGLWKKVMVKVLGSLGGDFLSFFVHGPFYSILLGRGCGEQVLPLG